MAYGLTYSCWFNWKSIVGTLEGRGYTIKTISKILVEDLGWKSARAFQDTYSVKDSFLYARLAWTSEREKTEVLIRLGTVIQYLEENKGNTGGYYRYDTSLLSLTKGDSGSWNWYGHKCSLTPYEYRRRFQWLLNNLMNKETAKDFHPNAIEEDLL